MEILLGSHYYHPHIGGIESVVKSHASRLADRGHKVTVVSTDIEAKAGHTDRDGYSLLRYRAWNPAESLGIPYPLPNVVDAQKKIKSVLNDSTIDVVHLHGINYLTSSVILRCVPSDIPVVIHQHTPFVDYPTPFNWIQKLNDNTVGRWNLKQAGLVFCVSPEIERYVNSIHGEARTKLLTNGVDTEFFNPGRARSDDVYDCSPGTPVFFTLSRMSQKKGVDVLLEAVKYLDEMNVNAHIAVAGDGPLRKEVEQMAQNAENMTVIGNLSDSELAVHYASSDAFLFTSKSGEAFPTLTMIESYASGTPVVASKLSDNADGVNEDNTVFFTPGESQDLATKIRQLSNDRDLLREMGASARETAVQQFSIESRINQLESQYRDLTVK